MSLFMVYFMFVVVYIQGFGWAIAKALSEAGASVSLGVWVSFAVLRKI